MNPTYKDIVIFHATDFKSKATAAYLLWIHRKLMGMPRDNIMLFSVNNPTNYELPVDVEQMKDHMFAFVGCQVHPLVHKAKVNILIFDTPFEVRNQFTYSADISYPHEYPEFLEKMFTPLVPAFLLTDEQMEAFHPYMEDMKDCSGSHWDKIRKTVNDRINHHQETDDITPAREALFIVTCIVEEVDTYLDKHDEQEVLKRVTCYPWYGKYKAAKSATTDHEKMLIGQALFLMLFATAENVWRSEDEQKRIEQYRVQFEAGASIYNTDVDHVQFWFTLFDEVQPTQEEHEVTAEVTPPAVEESEDTITVEAEDAPTVTSTEATTEAPKLHIPTMDEVRAEEQATTKAEAEKETPPQPFIVLKPDKKNDTEGNISYNDVLIPNVKGNFYKLSGMDMATIGSAELLNVALTDVILAASVNGKMLHVCGFDASDVKSAYQVQSHSCGCGDEACDTEDKNDYLVDYKQCINFECTGTVDDETVTCDMVASVELQLEYDKATHEYIAHTPKYLKVYYNASSVTDVDIAITGFVLSVTVRNPDYVAPVQETSVAEAAPAEKKMEMVDVYPDMTDPHRLVNQVYQAGCAIMEHMESKERYIARSCSFPIQITLGETVLTLISLNTPPARVEIMNAVMKDAYDGYLLFDHLNRNTVLVIIDLKVLHDEMGTDTLAMETWLNTHMLENSAQVSISPTQDKRHDRFFGSFMVTRDTWNDILDASEIDRSDTVTPKA